MRSNRLLAMLLVICLVVSVIAPAASAVTAGPDSIAKTDKAPESNASANKTSPFTNDRLASLDAQGKNNLSLRDDPFDLEVVEKNEQQTDGEWTVSPAAKPEVDLPQVTTPAWLKELKDVSSLYKVDEVVRAFVVMEDAPLAETHKSPLLVSAGLEKQMIEKQNSVIAAIEKNILSGDKLNVRYQFTYLANAISVETAFANLEKIAALSGVKGVVLVPTYAPCEVSNPNTAASGAMTGVHTVWQDLGYTGQGMKIAVIDTGLDLDHPSFAALDAELVAEYDSYMSVEDIDAVLDKLNATERRGTVVAKNLYRSTKVPYAFNYCDNSLNADHSMDSAGDHGTHVSGIAAANKLEGTQVVGMAPDAQIIVMKVFGANGGAYTDDIVAALEDAMTLGCDVVNASLGSPAGFSATGEAYIDSIYDMLANQDIVATISAGNEGPSSYDNMWGTDLNRTQNPENGSIGSPALYNNAFSVASAENCEVQTPYFALADGTKVFFNNDSYGFYYGYTPGMAPLIGLELEYVVIDGLGYEEDYYDADGNSLVEGKVAVVSRGEISFGEKIFNAELAGAVACIVANNVDDDVFEMMMNDSLTDAEGNPYFASIPTCMISKADGEAMAAAETKTMTVSEETAARVVEGGQMSSFSSWGTSSDLRLVPEITGIGGNVYSCYDGGKYGLMSGTSMSAPQIAGITALVMQALHEKFPEIPNNGAISMIAKSLLMSTADPIVKENGVEASPRQQGAGLVNAAEALKTNAVLVTNAGVPKAELGDSKSGVFTFSFVIGNLSNKEETYTLSSSLLTEDIVDYGIGEYFMAGQDVALTGKVTFSQDTVTVPADGSVEVDVTVTLSDSDKAMFARYWENGGFVEGYVYLENADENGVDLNMPFMGFYGDWTQAPIFDSAFWYENSFWRGTAPSIDGDEFQHVLWTDLGGNDWVLGFNPYIGALVDGDGNVIFDPANISISPNGDGIIDGISEIYLSLLRNAKTLTITYTDVATGEILSRETTFNNSKTMFRSSYGQIVPWLYSWYGSGMYDFKGLENNTKVKLSFDATVDYEGANEHSLEFVITVDTQAPVVEDAYQVVEEDGSHSLVVIVRDNINVGGVFLMNPAGTQIYGEDYALDQRADGSYLASFNVDDLGTEFSIVAGDYAGNESYYEITYTEAGDNLPEMDTSKLYAYRINDATIEYYMGYDYMFGWTMIDDPLAAGSQGMAWLQPLTNDYMESYALTAAEYAGGKVFAVDANQDLVVMEPGVWNRTKLCNLGMTVMDMTFDDSTDTMYLLAKQDSYYIYLMSLDLMTGETEEVAYLGVYYRAPLAMTDDDNGTLYMVKYNGSNLYYTSAEAEWELAPVTVAVGTDEETGETLYEDLELTHSDGSSVSPVYSQSMTYYNGLIYWAALTYDNPSELILIDVETPAFASCPIATYYDFADQWAMSDPELVGLISLVETDYQLPVAESLEGLVLTDDMLVLAPGQSATLGVDPSPWNYELGELTWESSDADVATVVDGKITAVSNGVAIITVSSENVSAECYVVVLDTETTYYAYNYYSGDGNYETIIRGDTASMNYSVLGDAPVDFLAADYNGHDNHFYGYTDGGQLWKMDMETGEATKLGDPTGFAPADMAYDYTSGIMYAVVQVGNGWSVSSVLCTVNLATGELMPFYELPGIALMTLACDANGILYSLTSDGMLAAFTSVYDDYFEEYTWMAQVLMQDLGYMQYMQSMCYVHGNNALLWASPENASLIWIDLDEGVCVSLGDPTGAGPFQFVGLFTIPEEIPELPPVAVDYVEAADMALLVGATKVPAVTFYPSNATCKDITWTSENPAVAAVTESGSIKGISEGTTEITGVLKDTVGGGEFELTFSVSVVQGADEIYGFVLTDFASYGGQVWDRIYVTDPSNPDLLLYTNYVIFAEEYYDGKVYAYGYDPNDWSANWQYFVMDAESLAIEEQMDMGVGFPFVYDMTYDYNTSTMYATAGPSDDDANLYVVDMETGALTLMMMTEQFFMSIAAADDGIYLMASSEDVYDEEYGDYLYSTGGQLYKLDTDTMTVEFVGDVGVKSNMIASMSYDYDTQMMYWTPFYQGASNESCLAMIDLETATASSVGAIGMSGSQVSGLYIISDEFPEEEDTLYGALIANNKMVLFAGQSDDAILVTMPTGIDAQVTWESADESIATVDENGTVTALKQGKTTVTATITYKGITKVCTCTVGVLDAEASFLTWNRTDMGWSTISRQDYTVVENLTEGETVGVSAIDSVNGTVYGVDALNQLFKLDFATYDREPIAELDDDYAIETYLAMVDPNGTMDPGSFNFEVRDMAYDEANERMLVLGAVMMWNADSNAWFEIDGGDSLYSVDLTTGALTRLSGFGEYYNVYGLAVNNAGTVYFYSAFNDHICTLDVTTGETKLLVSTQTQSVYGTTEGDIVRHNMYYDELSDSLYMTMTGNNSYYRMAIIDAATGALTAFNEEGNQLFVGEVIMDHNTWRYVGDLYTGMTFVDIPNFVAMVNEVRYESLEEAIAAAAVGDTIVLLDNVEPDSVVLPNGFVLDLNGNNLTTDYFVAFGNADVIDSKGSGVLACENLRLAENNSYLPVWDEEAGGYRLFVVKDQQKYKTQTADGFVFIAKPLLGSEDNSALMAQTETNRLSVKVRMRWTTASGNTVEQLFTVKAEDVTTIYTMVNKVIQMSVSGAGAYAGSLVTDVYLVSDTGVVWTSADLLYEGEAN